MSRRRAEVEQVLHDRLERAINEGELPPEPSAEELARYFAVMIQSFALQAQHGGTAKELTRVIDVAMANWPDKPSLDATLKG